MPPQETPLAEKYDRAIAAATIFSQRQYKGYAFWVVDVNLAATRMVGNAPKLIRETFPDGISESVVVRSWVCGIKFDWWEAEAIALALVGGDRGDAGAVGAIVPGVVE